MKAHFAYLSYKINSSFWFLPSLITIGSVALAFAAVYTDRSWIGVSAYSKDWLFTAEPESVRQMLVTIAGSMITVASLVFSITLVALTLASQQLGPRLLTNFKEDRANQLVLGVFVGTFVYSLLVLGTVSSAGDTWFVPYCAAVVAVVLAIGSFGVLIFFFHHMAESIEADFVIAQVFQRLVDSIDTTYPEEEAGSAGPEKMPKDAVGEGADRNKTEIATPETGYIQAIDVDALRDLAETHSLTLELLCRPGHFVVETCPIAEVAADGPIDGDIEASVSEAIVVGPKRTPTQDIEYQIRALVEIAVRALSAGVNDHNTALTCIDQLGAALARILRREMPDRLIRSDSGEILVKQDLPDFQGLMDASFHDIRQNSSGDAAVSIRLVQTLTMLSRFAATPARRAVIRRHAEMIERATAEFIFEPCDRDDVTSQLKPLFSALDAAA